MGQREKKVPCSLWISDSLTRDSYYLCFQELYSVLNAFGFPVLKTICPYFLCLFQLSIVLVFKKNTNVSSVARLPCPNSDSDPAFHLDADPDPSLHFDAKPTPTFHFDMDPDPTF
jgi:hypothetical protein